MKMCCSMFNACSMHVLSSISMFFYTVSLSCYMHRSSSWHLSDHGWAVTSMDLAVCQCLPIGTCRILLHHSRRPFLNSSPPYTALIHFMQFMHLYTVFLTPLSFRFWSLQKVSWDLDVCSTACQWDGEISSAAPSRFLQDMSVNLTSSIMLGRCRLPASKEIEDVISAPKYTAVFIMSCWCC